MFLLCLSTHFITCLSIYSHMFIILSSSSQLWVIWPSRKDIWQKCLHTFLVVKTRLFLWAFSGQRPRMLPNVWQSTGQPAQQRIIQPKMSIMLKLRNPTVEKELCWKTAKQNFWWQFHVIFCIWGQVAQVIWSLWWF